MELKPPLVSVIIPVFNAEAFIVQTLRSVLEQTFNSLEVLVVDDGSTDGTHQVVMSIVAQDPRVRWIRLDENSGRPAVPRNRGVAEARGDFIAFLDADDLWTKRKLEDQVSVMMANPDLVLVYSMVRNIGEVDLCFELSPLPWRAALSKEDLEQGKTIPCLTVLMPRGILNQLGGFDEDPHLKAIEDYELWHRASECGPIGFIPRVHGMYRVRSSGIFHDVDARNRRLRYLQTKRDMRYAPFVPIRQTPSFLWNQLRNVIHMGVLTCLKSEEMLARVAAKRIPLRRSTSMRLHSPVVQ